MRKNQQLVIVLPEGSEELPIRIVRGSRSMELRLCLCLPMVKNDTSTKLVRKGSMSLSGDRTTISKRQWTKSNG